MWCDDFDTDLLKVFPTIGQWFQQPIVMWTLCRPTADGKINCPASWHGLAGGNGLGSMVFVQHWSPRYPRDDHGWVRVGGYTCNDPWVMCNPLELIRDLWVHSNRTLLLHERIPRPVAVLKCDLWERDFQTIMYDVRGWGGQKKTEVADARYRCLRRLWWCARKIEFAGQKSAGLLNGVTT